MKTALLVIDVQCGLFDDSPRPFEADAVIDRINALTAQARTAGVPVVFIQHERASGPIADGQERAIRVPGQRRGSAMAWKTGGSQNFAVT